MTYEDAYLWATGNWNCKNPDFPPEIGQSDDPILLKNFLQGLYLSQDAGEVNVLECEQHRFACGVQHAWSKLNVHVDNTMPLTDRTETRHVIRPMSLIDDIIMNQILYQPVSELQKYMSIFKDNLK